MEGEIHGSCLLLVTEAEHKAHESAGASASDMGTDYRYLYDDPYVLMAHSILSIYDTADIKRMLIDDDFVRRLVLKETRLQDFAGVFLDGIVQSILDDKRRMEFMHELDKLADYFWRNLDIVRLRSEIIKYGTKYNIIEL